MSEVESSEAKLEQAIAALEAQRSVLGDAVDPAIAALQDQLALLRSAGEAAEDQRKQVTVVFADVQGFTSMSQTMDPEDVADVMNGVWAEIDAIITAHGGTIDKHIGDAVMALFGAPVAREDDPERAIRAALEMQDALKARATSDQSATSGLAMRIGIHTGLAMLGNVGARSEYTAIGHTVNLASRLEGKAPPGGILISYETMTHVRGLFDVVASDPIQVKGIEAPVRAYLVKRAKPRTFRTFTREVAGVETRTVGREEEMAQLLACLPESPASLSPRLVTIYGEPGVGKSRLIYDFFNHLEAQPHPVWLFRGRALEASRNTPYGLLRTMIFDRFLITASDSSDAARAKLEEGLAGYMGADGRRAAPFIGHLVGLDYADDASIADLFSEAKVIRERAFQSMVEMFHAGIGERYLVILCEDIHWADGDSLDFLEFLVTTSHMPLLIVATTRPDLVDRRPEWRVDRPDRAHILLEPLEAEKADELIAEVLRPLGDVPAELRTLIAERSEGNPFFLEELVKMLIDDGVVETGGGSWTVRLERLTPDAVPGTLTGVLQARVDSLNRAERHAVQRASIVGRVFWEPAVDHLAEATALDQAVEHLADVAAPLVSRELIYPREDSAFDTMREYIFKHAILRDVVYETVVKRVRRTYHEETAQWLVETAGDRASEFAGEIADHLRQAELLETAIGWYVTAGDQARRSYASEAAAIAYTAALELSADAPGAALGDQRRAALEGLGDVLTAQGRYHEAIDRYIEMRDSAVVTGDAATEARAERGMAAAQTYLGRFRDALESAERSEIAAARAESPIDLMKALWMQAWSRLRLGLNDGVAELSAEVLARSRAIGDRPALAQALNLAGVAEFSSGSYDEAIAHFDEAARIFEAIGNPDEVMPVMNNIGVILEAKGDYAGAVTCYSQALQIAKSTNNRDGEMVYLSNLGGAQVATGSFAEGEASLRTVVAMAGGSLGVLAETKRFLAEALIGLGRLAEAEQVAIEALDQATDSEAGDYIAAAWRVIGVLGSLTGRPIEVDAGNPASRHAPEEAFSKSLEMAESISANGERARTLVAWARHDAAAGRLAEAARRWHEGRRLLLLLGAESEVKRLQIDLGFLDEAPPADTMIVDNPR
ncbi:MAG TPA: adenylate/guanylate cyclase domain-containing protein [Acidimicrobiia bacterium]